MHLHSPHFIIMENKAEEELKKWQEKLVEAMNEPEFLTFTSIL